MMDKESMNGMATGWIVEGCPFWLNNSEGCVIPNLKHNLDAKDITVNIQIDGKEMASWINGFINKRIRNK